MSVSVSYFVIWLQIYEEKTENASSSAYSFSSIVTLTEKWTVVDEKTTVVLSEPLIILQPKRILSLVLDHTLLWLVNKVS